MKNNNKILKELATYISLTVIPNSWKNCFNDINKIYQPLWLNDFNFQDILTFYDFEESFKLRFFQEIENLNKDKKLNYICFIMYYILYYADNKDYYNIWSWNSTLNTFKNHGSYMINVVALLCGYKIHLENMTQKNFDKEQINYQKKNIKLTCLSDKNRFNLDGIRFSQMIWGSFFIKGYLIQVGRLQYEIGVKNFEKLNKYFGGNNTYVYIHIPRGESLKEEDVSLSLNSAKNYIKKFYPELNKSNLIFYTQTWLLSPELKEILSFNSNIIKFQNRFNILEYESNTKDFLNFVFNDPFDNMSYNDLPEKTSLQKELKLRLIKGSDLHLGLGVLKLEKSDINE